MQADEGIKAKATESINEIERALWATQQEAIMRRAQLEEQHKMHVQKVHSCVFA